MNPEELIAFLDDLKKRGKLVDIPVCPQCKSTRLRRVGSLLGDMSGHMALTLPKFECLDCTWRGRLTLIATNRPLDRKSMAVVASVSTSFDRTDDVEEKGE